MGGAGQGGAQLVELALVLGQLGLVFGEGVAGLTARSDGFLYRLDEIRYKLRGGTVVGFAIYGWRLAHFRHLTSYEKFLTAFGSPDQTRKDTEGGKFMGYTAYYWGARKQVQWDDWDRRIILINLGDFEGNTGP
ncbi:hypothetical protein [Nonomuraea wenchangensis]|uniref:hypothetical protein n=1 Tax=Nonomuraea wenchangensis TaxID=568860 RepID=UPI000B88D9EB|nr:hypothetical protein [Nonomuraea wenchangensis]